MKAKKFLGILLVLLTLTVFFVTVPVPVGSSSNQALATTNCQGGWINICPSFGSEVTNPKPKDTNTKPPKERDNKNELNSSTGIGTPIFPLLLGVLLSSMAAVSLLVFFIRK